MPAQLEPTGERVIEDAYHRSLGGYVIYVLHAASYRYAERACAGRKVIDLGCGSGYGAARIAKVASSVHAVDISEDAINFARERYEADNLNFLQVAPDKPQPFGDETFDVALSFQVIEHVHDDQAYLREALRILKPGGVLIVITPDRKHRLLPWQKPWNRWHLREYSAASLKAIVEKLFEVKSVQKMGAAWAIAGVEHRRYRWLKWLTLPVTLPFLPEMVRRSSLDLLHRLRRRPLSVSAHASPERIDFGFDEIAVIIAEDAPYSVNLVVTARKRKSG